MNVVVSCCIDAEWNRVVAKLGLIMVICGVVRLFVRSHSITFGGGHSEIDARAPLDVHAGGLSLLVCTSWLLTVVGVKTEAMCILLYNSIAIVRAVQAVTFFNSRSAVYTWGKIDAGSNLVELVF